MKNKKCFIFLFLAIVNTYSYTTGNHELLAKASIHNSLPRSNYNKLYKFLLENNYIDILVKAAGEPDWIPLTDEEVRENSELSNYTFEGLIDSKLNEISNEILNIDAFPFGDKLEERLVETVDNKLQETDKASGMKHVDKLRCATQHTYVYHPEKKHHRSEKLLGDFTIGPYAAQAEYNLAKKVLGGVKFSEASAELQNEALRRIGRVLHYIQDITTPSSCELVGNFNDLFINFSDPEKYPSYTTNQDEQEGESIEENYFFDPIKKEFYRKDDNTEKFQQIKWELKEIDDGNWGSEKIRIEYRRNGFIDGDPLVFSLHDKRDIKNTIIDLRNDIYDSRLMDFCDGVERYTFLKYENLLQYDGYNPKVILQYKLFHDFLPQYFDRQYDRQVDRVRLIPRGTATTTEVTVDNDMLYVSDLTVPLAIKEGARILAQFFYEVEGITRDQSLEAINFLLLD